MQKLTFKPFATLGKTNETLRLSEDGRRLAEDKKVRTSRGSDGLGQDGASDHGGERTFNPEDPHHLPQYCADHLAKRI